MTIEDLLRESFASHETLADPARAQEIARAAVPARKRTWPALLAAAAVVITIAGGAAWVASAHSTHSPSRPMDAANRATAQATARRLLHALPMPSGSVEHQVTPTWALARPTTHRLPQPTWTYATWWTVPLTKVRFQAWLDSHQPAPMRGGFVGSRGNGVDEYDYSSASNPAYIATVRVFYIAAGPRTEVRVEAAASGRYARTAETRPAGRVTSIDLYVDNGPSHFSDGGPRPPVHVTDPTTIAQLTGMFNGLLGGSMSPTRALCDPEMMSEDRLTFHTAAGDLVADVKSPGCGGHVTLTAGGTLLPTTLDPGLADGKTTFGSAVEKLTPESPTQAGPPVPPVGKKWIGVGDTVFAVPSAWKVWPELYCGSPDAHSYVTLVRAGIAAGCGPWSGVHGSVVELTVTPSGTVTANDPAVEATRITLPSGWLAVPRGLPADGVGTPTVAEQQAALNAAGFKVRIVRVGRWGASGPALTTQLEIGAPELIGSTVDIDEHVSGKADSGISGQLVWTGGPAPGTPTPHRGTVHVTGGSGFDEYIATDLAGRWRVALPQGTYTVRATSPGYLSRAGATDACTSRGSDVRVTQHAMTTARVTCQLR